MSSIANRIMIKNTLPMTTNIYLNILHFSCIRTFGIPITFKFIRLVSKLIYR